MGTKSFRGVKCGRGVHYSTSLWGGGVKIVFFLDAFQNVTGASCYSIRWKLGTCFYECFLSSKAVLSILYELLYLVFKTNMPCRSLK